MRKCVKSFFVGITNAVCSVCVLCALLFFFFSFTFFYINCFLLTSSYYYYIRSKFHIIRKYD